MSTVHKLHVKIGAHQFEAEGSEQAVQGQFERFLAAIANLPAAAATAAAEPKQPAPPPAQPVLPPEKTNGNGNGNGAAPSLDPAMRDRIFTERNGVISLRILPPQGETRDADAVLLLLYGYRLLKDEHDVPVTQLIQAVRQSGLQMDRVDRTLTMHERFITKGGFKRGSRYGLNNQGVIQAEAIIRNMLT